MAATEKDTSNLQVPEDKEITHLTLDHADDNSSYGNSGKESEEARLGRIAQMFMARTSNSEEDARIQKTDAEVRKIHKKKLEKKDKRKGKKRSPKYTNTMEECQEANESNIINNHDSSVESEEDETSKERGKSQCFFGFLKSWLEKRREKRAKKHLKKNKGNKNSRGGLSVKFSDDNSEVPPSERSYDEEDLTGNKFDQNAIDIDGVDITVD